MGPRLMTSIVPQLGPGLHGSERPPAGMISHQPILASGLPLDDVVGAEFAILGEPEVLDNVSPATKDRWRESGAVVLPGEATTYLAELGAKAIIIRPDRYILGVASSPSQLDRISECLPASYAMA
jgi:3-(3-hydroxy-phenyl)propionate hydroxylase